MKLYHHKTDGGAEYLTDKLIDWKHNGKSGEEGFFGGANFIVRIDGDITKDAELMIKSDLYLAAHDLLASCEEVLFFGANALAEAGWDKPGSDGKSMITRLLAAIAKAKGK